MKRFCHERPLPAAERGERRRRSLGRDGGLPSPFFSDLKTTIAKVAHGLLRRGVAKNDVILILAPKSILFPVCFLGVVAVGAIANTVNPVYTVHEISKQVKNSNPKLVVTVPELWDKVKQFTVAYSTVELEVGGRGVADRNPNPKTPLFSFFPKFSATHNLNPPPRIPIPETPIPRTPIPKSPSPIQNASMAGGGRGAGRRRWRRGRRRRRQGRRWRRWSKETEALVVFAVDNSFCFFIY